MRGSDWMPIRKLLDLERDIEEAFGALIDEPWGRTGRGEWAPAVDIDETPDGYHVAVDLPGVRADSIELHVRPREIEIRGIRASVRTAASARRIHTERRVGRFRRVFPLEHPVDPRTAEGRCEEGVYHIQVNKRSLEDPHP